MDPEGSLQEFTTWPLSWASWIQSTPNSFKVVLILPSHLRVALGRISSLHDSRLKFCVNFSFPPHVLPISSFLISFGEEYNIWSSILYIFPHYPLTLHTWCQNNLSTIFSVRVLPLQWEVTSMWNEVISTSVLYFGAADPVLDPEAGYPHWDVSWFSRIPRHAGRVP